MFDRASWGCLKVLLLSAKAVKSLFEFNFCELLKQMITYYSYLHHDSDKVLYFFSLYYLVQFCGHAPVIEVP